MWSAPSAKAANLHWGSGFGESDKQTLDQIAAKFLGDLDQRFHTTKAEFQIWVERIPDDTRSQHQAVAGPHHLALRLSNQGLPLPEAEKISIFKHELTHTWLDQQCHQANAAHPFLGEFLAQYLSGDFQRLVGTNSHFTKFASAKKFLFPEGTSLNVRTQPVAEFELALARMILQVRANQKSLEHSLNDLFADSCQNWGATESNILQILAGHKSYPMSYQVEALWVNLETQEILLKQGQTHLPKPVGSLLKPVLVDQIPELQKEQFADKRDIWNCRGSTHANGERWDWPAALSFSCNGFFLSQDFPIEAFRKNLQVLTQQTIQTMPEAIGLVPSLRLSLSDVATLYSQLFDNQSAVLQALRGTLEYGTLSGIAESKRLLQWQALAKTGTVVTPSGGGALRSLVLIVPKGSDFAAPSLLVLRGEGVSRAQLVQKAVQILKQSPSPLSRSTQVEVLSLLANQDVQITCVEGPQFLFQNRKTSGCLRGGLGVEVTLANGKTARKIFFGTLTELPQPPHTPSEDHVAVSARQVRARKHSRWLLKTSLREYVSQTLAAEGAGYEIETLKALGWVIRNNVIHAAENGQPLCDSSRCQVFLATELPPKSRLRFQKIASELESFPFLNSGAEPLFFSTGGKAAWTKIIPTATVAQSFGYPQFLSLKMTDKGDIAVNGQSFPCEKVRSALHLLTCPQRSEIRDQQIEFHGQGEGHGLGLDLTAANQMALRGAKAEMILTAFFPQLVRH